MGKLNDSAMTTTRGTVLPTKVATNEQIRMARLLDPKGEDHSSLEVKVHSVMELTHCDEDSALVALHDCGNDVEQAVDKLLECGEREDEWIVQESKKSKKSQQSTAVGDSATNDAFENADGKSFGNRRDRGPSRRGDITGFSSGPSKFRGRGGNAGNRNLGSGKENESRSDFLNGERGGYSRGRGRDGFEKSGRGRGFGGRGGRRGGGGFNSRDTDGFGMGNWNAPEKDNNTWDNSMANPPQPEMKLAGEWGKRRAKAESNTWDNSMAQTNVDSDWGGEEEWSKVRGGLVVEQSGTHKSPDKAVTPVQASSPDNTQPLSANVSVHSDVSRIRGESIDVNSLFTSQASPQQSFSSSPAWTSSSKQATVDLKNELGIGKSVSPLVDSNSRVVGNGGVVPAKPIVAKVEMPGGFASASMGPFDIQFGDMTLVSDTLQPTFDHTANYQTQNTIAQPQLEERQIPSRQDPRSMFLRPASRDHVNTSSDLLPTVQHREVGPKLDGTSGYARLPQKPTQQVALEQKDFHQQQHSGLNRAPETVANISAPAPVQTQKPDNFGVSVFGGEYPRTSSFSSINSNPMMAQHSAINDSNGLHQLSRDDSLGQINMAVINAASAFQASSKNPTTVATANSTASAYQAPLLPSFLPMSYDQSGLSYLPTPQNLLVNGFDMRALTGAGMTVGRDSGDLKPQLVRQENGSSVGALSAAATNVNVPPPGLPAPTASNAEQAAQLAMNMGLYHPLHYLNPASPFLPPQFYVPNVSSTSALTNNSQYQRSGAYQSPTAPAMFNATGYDDLQQFASQHDFGKPSYGSMPSSTIQNKPASANGGLVSGLNIGNGDMNKLGGGIKMPPFDSKQFSTTAGTLTPAFGNMNLTPGAAAPYGYGYYPGLNMNMLMTPGLQTSAQISHDLLNQRMVNQNGKTTGGLSGSNKTVAQQFPYGTPWGN